MQDSEGKVTTDKSWNGVSPTITGDEYFLILKATLVADGTNFEVSIPVELKNGKGASTLSVAALFAMIPGGVVKSVEATGADVYGPLGVSNAEDCLAAIMASGGIFLEAEGTIHEPVQGRHQDRGGGYSRPVVRALQRPPGNLRLAEAAAEAPGP